MTPCHPSAQSRSGLPLVWLLSDARNDASLEDTLVRLPRGSGFVYRHYHLAPDERAARFAVLAQRARACGHRVVLSGSPAQAEDHGADGVYGATDRIGLPRPGLLRLATAHDADELAAAERAGADGVFLSPVFPTRSHPDGAILGEQRFLALAKASALPVIALGGMTADRAAALDWPRWGAIDGLIPSPNSA
ncbi:MAG: thiamine phosphate synthase [Erythrobacter sp.]|nr:thiamine phosphate synthase [Erythrobacter sp.]